MKDLDKIILPDNIDEITRLAVERGEREKKIKKKSRKSIIAASIAGFMLLGVFVNTEGVRAAIEEVRGSIEGYFEESRNGKGDNKVVNQALNNHKAVVNQTVEDEGVKLTLSEFYMNNEDVYFYFTASNEGKKDDILEGVQKKIYLNKDLLKSNSSMMGKDFKGGIKPVGIIEQNAIEKLDISNVDRIKVEVNAVIFYDSKLKKNYVVNGNWKFSFDYDGNKAMKNIKYIDIDDTKITKGENQVVLDKMKITPFSIRIYGKDYVDKCKPGDMIKFVLEDSKGNMIYTSGECGVNDKYNYDFILDTTNTEIKNIIPMEFVKDDSGGKEVYHRDQAIKLPTK
ncbi:MAG: DUF4179 domain-containing protein [Clostridium sp.]